MLLTATVLAAPLLVSVTQAHQIWLERDGVTARVYFGEPIENVRERSGALLDRISNPRIFANDAMQPLPIQRQADHLSVSLPAGQGDVRLIEESLAPFGRVADQRTKTVMLAREGHSETRGLLDLEAVMDHWLGDDQAAGH